MGQSIVDKSRLRVCPQTGDSALSATSAETPVEHAIKVVHRGRWAADLTQASMYVLIASSDPAPSPNDLAQVAASQMRSLAPGIWKVHKSPDVYRERVLADERDELICVRREYGRPGLEYADVVVTSDQQIARQWARARSDGHARRGLARAINKRSKAESQTCRRMQQNIRGLSAKRLFDIAFSSIALLLTAPLFPIVMLAIWLEDGSPAFFVHRRQARGGHEFGCIKFRVMRADAEQVKSALGSRNRSDGPQFFLPDDPRLLKVGWFLRRWNIDELPQFINVLLGHMSVVGPRPSPDHENQFCPSWREARLSVRPGLTGLWQVCRTRRPKVDFQEWIRYDLEYVEQRSWMMDMSIILRTPLAIFGGLALAVDDPA